MRLVGYSSAPRQPFPNHPPDLPPLLAPIDLLWDPGQRTARRIQPTGVDEDCGYKGEEVQARDDEDVVDFTLVEGFADVVAGGDEEEDGEDEGEEGEACGVEDAEERDVGVGTEVGGVHSKDIDVASIANVRNDVGEVGVKLKSMVDGFGELVSRYT